MVLMRLFMGYLVGAQDTSTCLLLPRNTGGLVNVKYRGYSSRGDLLDLGCFPFSFVFNLNCGQEFTPIFIGKGEIFILMVLQLILHGCDRPVLNSKLNFTERELLVADSTIICLSSFALQEGAMVQVGEMRVDRAPESLPGPHEVHSQ